MASRALVFLYSLICYAAGLTALLYAIGFIGGYLVPKTIDSGVQADLGTTLATDLALLGLFAVQHSVMARQGFKRRWTKLVPKAAERATYVLASAGVLGLLYWLWKPLPATLWTANGAGLVAALSALYLAGWGIVFLSTFLINHFELMGLQQSFAHLRGKEASPPTFKTPLLYRLVRHPIYSGLLLTFWATPHMTQGHLLFAIGATGYIAIGVALEERDLVGFFGDTYRDYRLRVPALVPVLGLWRRGGRKSRLAG